MDPVRVSQEAVNDRLRAFPPRARARHVESPPNADVEPAMRLPPLALLVFAIGCSSSSSDPSSADTGGETAPVDATHDVAFDIDTTPADSGCPLAYDPSTIDCTKACANYLAWCETTSCKSPYCDRPTDCATACNVTKGETGYTNALFGCAAQNTQCAAYETCVTSTCPSP